MKLANEGSTKIVFVDRPERLRELEPIIRARLEPQARVTFSVPEFLEVVNASVSKGAALAFVCESTGLDPAQLIAVGDAPNDVEMFRYAAWRWPPGAPSRRRWRRPTPSLPLPKKTASPSLSSVISCDFLGRPIGCEP